MARQLCIPQIYLLKPGLAGQWTHIIAAYVANFFGSNRPHSHGEKFWRFIVCYHPSSQAFESLKSVNE